MREARVVLSEAASLPQSEGTLFSLWAALEIREVCVLVSSRSILPVAPFPRKSGARRFASLEKRAYSAIDPSSTNRIDH